MTPTNPEEDLNLILKALSETQPTATLNTRILAALAEAEVGSRSRKQTTASAHLRIASAVLALAALLAVTLYLHRTPTQHPATPKPSPRIAAISAPTPIPTHHRPIPLKPIPTTQPAPNHPAPPEPLTSQESLLLQLAHQRNAPAINALRPELRAALSARETADFLDFFPKPLPPERLHPDGSIIQPPPTPTGDTQ